MLVEELKEEIQKIGQTFAYYDYGEEKGLVSCFRNKEAAAKYINGFVYMTLKGKFLYTTSEKKEAYIAYRTSEQKLGFSAVMKLIKVLFKSMSISELMKFIRTLSKARPDLKDRMDKEKKPYLHIVMLCVTEEYQGQGYMRKAMEMVFNEGNRLKVPIILDTDAKSKCDKYVHLGMELIGTRKFGKYGTLYDLIKYPI